MTNLVSVIIPCYNVESDISDCLDSVLNQTYKNIEVICIDNNSTDDTLLILKEYKEMNPNIILTSEKKQTASAARNKGLSLATGQFIQFLDADDILLPEKIARQVEILQIRNKDFVAGGYLKQYTNKTKQEVIPCNNLWSALINVKLGCTCSNMFKKTSLEKINGWNENIKSSQEYDLMFRLLKKNASVTIDKKALTVVRQREFGSISSNVEENIIRRIQLLLRIKNHLININSEKFLLSTVNQALFDVLRELYNFNKGLALKSYKEIFKKKPIIYKSSATSKLYVFLFKFFGFNFTQKINSFYKIFK